jgi:hypothetical protein
MKARVIDYLYTYTFYQNWAYRNGYLIDHGDDPRNGEVYEIVCSGKHFDKKNILYGLLKEDGRIFVVDEKGLEFLVDKKGNYLLEL